MEPRAEVPARPVQTGSRSARGSTAPVVAPPALVASEPEPEVVTEEPSSTDEPSAASGCPEPLPENMACIPGGVITRGTDDGPENERPAAQVRISPFLMDLYEVDNAHYRECVEARVCRRQMHFPGYMGSTQPAVAMRWQDADAYCAWRGKRLPTEAEFERAASGPDEHTYPWGEEVDVPCERAVVRTAAGRGCGTGVTWPVGSRPVGPWGLYDMSGNVWEWVSDHYSWCYRGCGRECGDDCFVDDPQGRCGDSHAECPQSLGHRTVRGGSWWYTIDRATTTARRGIPGENPNPHRFGFRCAVSASAAGDVVGVASETAEPAEP